MLAVCEKDARKQHNRLQSRMELRGFRHTSAPKWYVYVYIYTHIYIYIYTSLSVYIYIHIYIYIHVCIYIYIYLHKCLHILMDPIESSRQWGNFGRSQKVYPAVGLWQAVIGALCTPRPVCSINKNSNLRYTWIIYFNPIIQIYLNIFIFRSTFGINPAECHQRTGLRRS